MKTLSAIKFRLSELYMPTVIYVLLLFMASLAALIAGAIDKSGNVAEMNVDQVYAFSYYGTGFVAFLLGIISYKTHFKFLLQNGVSRQHIHLSFICSLVYAVLLYIENAGFHFLFSYVAHLTAKTDAPFNTNIPGAVLCDNMALQRFRVFGQQLSHGLIARAVLLCQLPDCHHFQCVYTPFPHNFEYTNANAPIRVSVLSAKHCKT